MEAERYRELRQKHGNKCPECDVDLTKVDYVTHWRTHYPEVIENWPQHQSAIERKAYLQEYAQRKGA